MTRTAVRPSALPGASVAVLALRDQLINGTMRKLAALSLPEREIDVMEGRDSVWAIVRRAGRGGLAVRACHTHGGAATIAKARGVDGEALRLTVESPVGRQIVSFRTGTPDLATMRITVELTPAANLLIPFMPRDLYPLDENDDPISARGKVEAAQRGLNSGQLFFHVDEPGFGTVLYFQNLTALNDYFVTTKTKPDAAVGGEWPELGFLPPTPPQSGTPPVDPLPKGKLVTISDAILVFHDDAACDEQDTARRFLQMMATAYRQLDLPGTEYRDWPWRAERTIRDLASREASIWHYGHRYIHPYTATEYPDVMVQMSLLAAIRDFEAWQGKKVPIGAELAAGLGKFHDSKLRTMRRYLPNVGKDKDKKAVDSWYLYHPLLNLGRLALDGDARAKRLFTSSLDYAIRAAHHFRYAWPIQFKVDTFDVITEARNDDGLGQTDVGGLYAYVMLQAYELTKDARYLDEARKAIDAVRDMRFELNYQANLTAWGSAACMRLWRITNQEYYLRQSYVYLASFFHNSAIWESQIEHAKHYSNFLGVTVLHDGPYMAAYECFDSFAAFERYLKDSGPDLDSAARMLISEYCKYALSRAWFYYPETLPADILAEKQRNGYIDCKLSFPLEDLYHDGQPAGQVGQEIYGGGAAMVFASRSFHLIEGAPFRLFCDHFLMSSERHSTNSISFKLNGGDECRARVSLVPTGRKKLPKFELETATGDRVRPIHVDGRVDFHIPASGSVTLRWTTG